MERGWRKVGWVHGVAGGTVGGERFRWKVGALRRKDEKREKNIRKASEWNEDGPRRKNGRGIGRERARGRKKRGSSELARSRF